MTAAYSRRLRELAREAAATLGFALEDGIYLAVSGPSFETPAEIRAFRALGATLVGMSTVPETIVARHMGIEVLGISCVTNLAAGIGASPLSHEEVEETGRQAGERGDYDRLLAELDRLFDTEDDVNGYIDQQVVTLVKQVCRTLGIRPNLELLAGYPDPGDEPWSRRPAASPPVRPSGRDPPRPPRERRDSAPAAAEGLVQRHQIG